VRGVRPRVGFAGLGWIGRHRLEAIAATGAVEVAALQDPVPAAVDSAAAIAPGAARMGAFDALLDMGLDGIVIASPSALHAGQALAALDAGAAVFCQKPLGRTAVEARRVVDRAREAHRLLAVDLCYPHTAAIRAMREVLEAGGIGRPFAADLTFHNAYGPDKPWFYDLTQAGGGAMMDLGTHLIGLALDIFGQAPEAVTADLYAAGQRLTAPGLEDYGTATLRFPGGATARIACSWNLHAGRDAVIAVDLHGTEGGLSLRNLEGSFLDFEARRHRGTASEVIAAPPDDWGGRAAADWARRLAQGARFDPAAERLVGLSETLDRVYEAGFCPQPLRASAQAAPTIRPPEACRPVPEDRVQDRVRARPLRSPRGSRAP
jgi:predicted dehydrogenase